MFLKKLDEHLLDALAAAGLEKANDFQKQCISRIKAGGDLIAVADEGRGKTTALVVALIQQLKAERNDIPRAIVLVESKERGEELMAMFALLGKNTDLRVQEVHETFTVQKLEAQKDRIYFGSDVVIGTPIAVGKLYSSNGLNLNDLRFLVIDDAHRTMIDKSLPQVDRMAEAVPRAQRLLFADRFSERLDRFADRYMHNPTVLEDEDEDEAPETISDVLPIDTDLEAK